MHNCFLRHLLFLHICRQLTFVHDLEYNVGLGDHFRKFGKEKNHQDGDAPSGQFVDDRINLFLRAHIDSPLSAHRVWSTSGSMPSHLAMTTFCWLPPLSDSAVGRARTRGRQGVSPSGRTSCVLCLSTANPFWKWIISFAMPMFSRTVKSTISPSVLRSSVTVADAELFRFLRIVDFRRLAYRLLLYFLNPLSYNRIKIEPLPCSPAPMSPAIDTISPLWMSRKEISSKLSLRDKPLTDSLTSPIVELRSGKGRRVHGRPSTGQFLRKWFR